MTRFDVRPGTPGLTLADVSHVIVPGRGRDATGTGLSTTSRARVDHAGSLYLEAGLTGRVVCSGYRTPGDLNGGEWLPDGQASEAFVGVPEADSMRRALLELGVPDDVIAVERHSVDTVTNFVRAEAEGHFGDDRPVAVVAQEAHLRRIMRIVAPRVLRRAYLGVVAPEPRVPDSDGTLPALVSRLVLWGLRADTENLLAVTERRVNSAWRAARYLRTHDYHADPPQAGRT